MRDVVEAALAYQHRLDQARMERTGGKEPPYVLVRSTRVIGVAQVGPRLWLVGLVREVEAPHLAAKEQVEFVTCRIQRDDGGYCGVEVTAMAAAKSWLSPFLIRLSWWRVRLKYLLKPRAG